MSEAIVLEEWECAMCSEYTVDPVYSNDGNYRKGGLAKAYVGKRGNCFIEIQVQLGEIKTFNENTGTFEISFI